MKAPVVEWLIRAAGSEHGHAVALKTSVAERSFSELAALSLKTAAVLRDQGVAPGSRVGLVLTSNENYVTALLGVLALGATAVPLNPLYRPAELAFHIRANRLKGIVADPSAAPVCRSAMAEAGRIGTLWTSGSSDCGIDIAALVEKASGIVEPAEVAADDVAIVLHTPGATGRVKLVPRTHEQLSAECANVASSLGITAADVIYGMLPLHHCHGLMNCLFAALRANCRLILDTDPRPFVLIRGQVLAAIAAERVTILPAIPFQLENLLAVRGDFDLSGLRICFTGGAALKQETYEGFKEKYGVAVRQQYGCAEAGAVTLNLAAETDDTWMTVGKPLSGTTVSVVDPDEDGIGEIAIGSAALTSGYEGQDELNARKFVRGTFLTGDLGYIDPDGNIHVVRRRPIYLDVAGHKVDATEVADTLRAHPGVLDVRVVDANSTPSAIKAVVTCSQRSAVADLRDFCRERLASYKVPSIFEIREAAAPQISAEVEKPR